MSNWWNSINYQPVILDESIRICRGMIIGEQITYVPNGTPHQHLMAAAFDSWIDWMPYAASQDGASLMYYYINVNSDSDRHGNVAISTTGQAGETAIEFQREKKIKLVCCVSGVNNDRAKI